MPGPRLLEVSGTISAVSTMTATLTMRWRRRWPSPRGGYAYEKIEGPDYFQTAGEVVHKLRIIDREGNWYVERVERSNGDVIVDKAGPLDEHIGFGSAKDRAQ